MSISKGSEHKGRSSLISRLAATTALLAAAIAVLAIISFHAIRGDIFQDAFEGPLEEWSVLLAGRIGQDPKIALAAAQNHRMGVVLATSDQVYAFGPDGEITTEQSLQQSHSSDRKIEALGHSGTRYVFYLNDEQVSHQSNTQLWQILGGFAFLMAIVYAAQVSLLRPLKWLQEGVEQVSRGDLSTRVPVVRMDEIGQVGRAFNHMTGRVEQMMNDHDRLMADVSHELRSPMARIKVALELLPEGEKRDSIADDIREMESLTSVLLERERIKNLSAGPAIEAFDLVACSQAIMRGFESRTPKITLCSEPDSIQIEANEALIKVLMQNLLDNAVKFSLEDSAPVQLQLHRDQDGTKITVIDDGPGIPENMTEQVLQPFVKLDPSRGHRKGYGLGLNLCQRIVRAHGGSIEITCRQPRGTCVSVTLPPVTT
jgi:signal transduction histidine kinase